MKREVRQTMPRTCNNPTPPALSIFPLAQETTSRINDTGSLEKSLEKIYERYGADLQAFFHDAYESSVAEKGSDDRM